MRIGAPTSVPTENLPGRLADFGGCPIQLISGDGNKPGWNPVVSQMASAKPPGIAPGLQSAFNA